MSNIIKAERCFSFGKIKFIPVKSVKFTGILTYFEKIILKNGKVAMQNTSTVNYFFIYPQ